MTFPRFTLMLGCVTLLQLLEGPAQAQSSIGGPVVGYPLEFKVSGPVGGLPPQAGRAGLREIPEHQPPRRPRPGNVTDPVVQSATPTPAAAPTAQGWEGLGAGYPGYSITAVPPDPNMAVGPNHIVQWVNNAFVVFNKQGSQLLAPVADSTFWGVLSTCYQGGGFSDPIVQYDRAADRWLIGEVALPLLPGLFGQYAQCFAVSTTGDPTGTYNMWAYGFGMDINDYPKIGVWPDGYYVTFNMFTNGTTFGGARACSFNRSAMIGGSATPARVCFQLSSAYDSVLPSDQDGSTAPPAGSPNFLMNVDVTAGTLNLWKFHVDYVNTNNSTLTGPLTTAVAPFNAPCPSTDECIPQPGTTQQLDVLGDRLMYRLAYRNFGDHESLVVNHTVSPAGTNTGIRWYEIRNPNGTPSVFQQGSYAPDSDYRWMGSIAMDHSGNIGLAYTIGSGATYPSLRYTGRQTSDPAGTLQAETALATGGGAQTGYGRWGDYSAMRIDPTDDCTFWFTGEYQATTQSAAWNTRIGSFRFPSCGQSSAPVATTTALASSANPSNYSQVVTFTATVAAVSGSLTPTGTVTFKDGATILGSSALNSAGLASLTSSTLAVGPHSITATYSGTSSFTGSASSVLTQTVNVAVTTTVVSSSLNPSAYGQSVTFTATVSPSSATGTVQFLDGNAVIASVSLSSGKSSTSTSALTVGSHSVTASYAGNANFGASSSAALSQTVDKANTTTTLTSSANPSVTGQSVTFTATISNPAATGTVTFLDGAQTLGTITVSGGKASLSTAALAFGKHSIAASYSGDNNLNASTSAVLSQNVKRR